MKPFRDIEHMIEVAAKHGYDVTPTQQGMHDFLWKQYQRLGSCRRVCALVGISFNCVQQHLRSAGYALPTSGGRRWHNQDLKIEFNGKHAHYLEFREHWHPELSRHIVYSRLFVYGWPVRNAFSLPLSWRTKR